MKTRLPIFVVLALASQLLFSCVASGPAYVGVGVGAPGPYYGPYYGPRYYPARPYYRPRTVIVDRPRYYRPMPGPRPGYYHNNVRPHRSVRVR
ncbi:hypothetical protein [Hymenobacter crusticola]|uniref:Neuropeptide-like protein 29 n=1 Tax=Hymenobacter crusticola TaxID=1770526 RepID=A0A243WBY0_9BACT|nr:hypothetical protein [Hymenobacter crusticola]OUJ73048.1 hypothetical protein BXP70_14490 [Hymenobacter crusticola]